MTVMNTFFYGRSLKAVVSTSSKKKSNILILKDPRLRICAKKTFNNN